jgi:hypothetical protein
MLVKYGLVGVPPEKKPNAPATISFVLSGSTATLGSELSLVSLLSLKRGLATRRDATRDPHPRASYRGGP